MELNKKNFNRILNNFIAAICIVLASVFIAIGFINPASKVSALTQADIEAYNIYFVAAKTKVRTATGIDRAQLTGFKDSNSYSYYDYQYNYNTHTDNLYYATTQPNNSNSTYGDISLSSGINTIDPSTDKNIITPVEEVLYTPFDDTKYSRSTGFIPNGIEYYDNIKGDKEAIFYNEINNGDYVLLENYTNHHTVTNSFNVENFYLSFGTTYIDDKLTTPLNSLRVEAKLFSEGTTHVLNTNEVMNIDIGDKKSAQCWNQYFDLKNLTARKTPEESSETYSVENTQGRYEITFHFIRYTEKLEPVSDTEETFTFSFYLLDSADYSNFPTINNATIGTESTESVQSGNRLEYFYHFETDTPYIEYDPSKYNVSYTRTNNKSINNVAENITSSYITGSYSLEGKNYPKGIITYYHGYSIQKQVFVLTYYNTHKSVVEHLYLSRTNPATETYSFNPNTYEDFESALNNDTLVFEYKITKVLTSTIVDDVTTYQINSYRTTTYDNHSILEDVNVISQSDETGSWVVTLADNTTNDNTDNPTLKYDQLDSKKVMTIEKDSDSNNTIVNYNGNSATFADYVKTEELIDTFVTESEGSYLYGQESHAIVLANDTLKTSARETIDDKTIIPSGYSEYYISDIKTDTNDHITKYVLTIAYNTPKGEETDTVDLIVDSVDLDKIYSVSSIANPHISIEYKVSTSEENNTERYISSIVLSIKNKINVIGYGFDNTTNQATNQTILYEMINYDGNKQLDLGFTYEYNLGELGIYDITYSYVSCADNNHYFVNTTESRDYSSTNTTIPNKYYSASSNRCAPYNFSAVKTNVEILNPSDTSYKESDLYIAISGTVTNTQVTLLNKTYTFDASKPEEIKFGSSTYKFNTEASSSVAKFDEDTIPNFFALRQTEDSYIVTAYYKIGEIAVSDEKLISDINYNNGSNTFRNEKGKQITYIYTLELTSNSISDTNPEFTLVKNVIANIETFTKGPDYNESNNIYSYMLTRAFTEVSEYTAGEEQLHVFGSISYFNKVNNYSDSNYTKLQQIDSKLNVNYISDVTINYIENYTPAQGDTKYGPNGYVTDSLPVASNFKGKIASLLTINEIIITDVTPVLWNNFSTLYYINNNKSSTSYIYRYSKYSVDTDGKIIPDTTTCVTSTYTKDVYCQFDGLYEIVVFYKYDNLPDTLGQNIYYQLFTFIIDNSSPSIDIEVEKLNALGEVIKDSDGNIQYEELGLNKYTNRNIRITWEVPSFFQNDVYLEIDKTYFNTTNASNDFNAIYQANKISLNSGNNTYVNGISKMSIITKMVDEKLTSFYCVDLKLVDENVKYDMDGNYKIIVHYSTKGKSTFTEEFIIDKKDIENMNILPVMKNTDGTYQVNDSLDFDDAQIINSDFTFRFDRKASKADIFVYYDKIDLTNSTDYDKIINLNNSDEFGISTKYEVNGQTNSISIGTPYVYEYTHEDAPNYVSSKNLLSSNNSCLYLFRLVDEAGNEARYVVFYDTTDPRFIISPEPDKETHIVNDTTRVIWGDYKAIKVNSDITQDIVISDAVDNYSKEEDTAQLSLVLRYLNNSNNSDKFNKLKVQLIDENYYIFVPVTNARIEDNEFLNTFDIELVKPNNATGYYDYSDYYFFPTNPIISTTNTEENYVVPSTYDSTKSNEEFHIVLPTYDPITGKVNLDNNQQVLTAEYKVYSYTISQELDSYNDSQNRYISVTYFIDSSSNATNTIMGSIGEGVFIFDINDENLNKTSGMLWMNLDKTQTMAYGVFNYSDSLNDAISFTEGTYAASKMYISSLTASVADDVPDYTVTYKHYAYDSSMYSDYIIQNIELIKADNSLETYLRLDMKMINSEITKSVDIQLTDEDGNNYPQYSYPYSLDGRAIVADTNSKPLDVYTKDGVQYRNNDKSRRFSLALNTTTDTSKQKNVTEEGLYIFKRTYTDSTLDLGTDKRIVYRVYYVDRNGIINVSTNSSVANTLYNIGNDIQFTLGSTYDIKNYQKKITASTIQNKQVAENSSYSNSDYSASQLFNTNKIQVEYQMTYDKYNFEKSMANHVTQSQTVINELQNVDQTQKENITNYLNNYLFNTRYFSTTYKIDLCLTIGSSQLRIIDEQDNYYSTSGIANYLKDNTTNPPLKDGKRNNLFYFYIDTGSNAYNIEINDQAGYMQFESDGITLVDKNARSNELTMTFNINHSAPDGNFYGKYYGRHDYDENKSNSDKPLNIPSIPIGSNGEYTVLEYLKTGQLDSLYESYKSQTLNESGNYMKLYSTNNETMIFTFAITNDEYKAQIDPNNIKIYKDQISDKSIIFNRENGNFLDKSLVSKSRQSKAFVSNVIDGVTYYAIIIFDNNLDEILDSSETDYKEFRLLDPEANPDKATYYIQIQYVGNANDYVGQDSVTKNKVNYYKTTFEITVDRIKPTYNITKLMSLDKYVYNPTITTPTSANHEALFNRYKSYYNFETDTKYDFERSDLENYFFAIDTRENSSFVFENISSLDNNGSLYIRQIDKDAYKFSLTPDDYKAYYNALYLQGHPQFTPSTATAVAGEMMGEMKPNKYYQVLFSLDDNYSDEDGLSAHYMKEFGILKEGCYYEIIESDEADNYRTYAIYVPDETTDKIVYSYQTNNDESSAQKVTLLYGNTPYVESSGMKLHFTTLQTKDNFLKVTINVKSDKIDHKIDVILDPVNLTVTAFNRTLGTVMLTTNVENKDKDGFANTEELMTTINKILDDYYTWTNDKTNTDYYSEYGYVVDIQVVNRIGVAMKNTATLYNYEIDYIVAGSTLYPIFENGSNSFKMILEGQKGSTYLTDITAYKFNKVWTQINADNSSTPQIFDKSVSELKKPITYNFTRGIYKFVFTDNFGRVNDFFYEFGISASATGGELSYQGATSKLTDGYTYSANKITYSYDSSVYNIYIKFTGKLTDEQEINGYKEYTDSDNFIVYSSNTTNSPETLKNFGIQVFTSGNITSITFSGSLGQILSKYHIKTIIASTTDSYKWGDELVNDNIFVYEKKVAIYTAIPYVIIRNMSGNTLTTKPEDPDHLNLTEDFELIISWPTSINSSERLSFNSKIHLTRTYIYNGMVKSTETLVESGYTITEPGDYKAYVINDLGKTSSPEISFTRGEGEISMYAVYGISKDSNNKTNELKLTPSSMIDSYLDKVLFKYFTTNNYCNYLDSNGNTINSGNMTSNMTDIDLVSDTSKSYIDVRVNSNLSIKSKICEVGYGFDSATNNQYPYVLYQIYSEITGSGLEDTTDYVYRYIMIIFVPENSNSTNLADVTVTNAGSGSTNLAETNSVITSNASSVALRMDFGDAGTPYIPNGDTLYLDRYYNGIFAETITVDTSSSADLVVDEEGNTDYPIHLTIKNVGLHEFVLRDLAGRTHKFNGAEKLKIYLINEVLFTVNGENPINNRVFNETVDINVVSTLDNMQLYNDKSLEIVVTRNGVSSSIQNSKGQVSLTEAGYYTVNLSAFTSQTETKVYSTYNFVIIDTEIANPSFSISKGTGFAIEKLVKIVNGQQTDITNTYSVTSSNADTTLLWLTHSEQNNSIFDITLKYYSSLTEKETSFNFRIWINDENPQILSSIPAGTKTKEVIEIRYNPGQIYQQVGKGYITINDEKIIDINSSSPTYAETITIEKKGTYWLKIYTSDGVLVSSYKFTKSEPMNNITKFILIAVAILVVVVVVLFFLLRRKGRYR